MEYFIVTCLLFVSILVYFRVADRFNIIDKPNHRSAHTAITLRGGGVVIPVAFLFFCGWLLYSTTAYSIGDFLIFGAGLLTICVISFVDDVVDLSSKIRILFHFIAVTLLLLSLHVFVVLPVWTVPLLYILIIGILNAYNFMDGINGITGTYSLVVLGSLWYVNRFIIVFTAEEFIVFPLLATLVFLFFNFRKKAKCFLGDIGSMGIAFWILALLGQLMIKTGEYKWILFLAVYGVEVIATLLERIKLKENIFEAHRRHLYQLFANERRVSHLIISVVYGGLQLLINCVIIAFDGDVGLLAIGILAPLVLLYFYVKFKVKTNLTKTHR